MEARRKHPRRPPRARAVIALTTVTLIGGSACGVSTAADGRPAPTPSTGPSATNPVTGPATERADPLPAPDASIPQSPAKFATALTKTTAALNDAIDAWSKQGLPPEDVELLALHQQRLYRHAARHPETASRAFARLEAPLAAQARDNTSAIRGLVSLARPIKPSAVFKVQEPRPAAELLGHFKKAERRFGVEWEVLAAVMFAETKFGRVKSPSYVGAQGPMQFMPATWKAYGLGGDVHDPRDAVMGAANYLRATGAPRDYRRALHAYNPSQAYVDAILKHSRQIKRDPRNYYAYYNWQVFVLTTKGERRLTGP
ncbi:lytic transglycosylase domain-containing protein [Nonomuraea jiangxiensis]|uniref:Transglycosylase SLT domain-containing protein n=1 Tax=Nonomuraea jiangxiensis TaxID=633440 RepID=A0A1G9GIV5_9ACTN|nr:lytic transglycosylase domain-containing protein [Nonomuraea jiangxiensis]SDL00619.1 Transglycosylase SLT domain-containing protein [Nonomuraea jiangxiensis]